MFILFSVPWPAPDRDVPPPPLPTDTLPRGNEIHLRAGGKHEVLPRPTEAARSRIEVQPRAPDPPEERSEVQTRASESPARRSEEKSPAVAVSRRRILSRSRDNLAGDGDSRDKRLNKLDNEGDVWFNKEMLYKVQTNSEGIMSF